MNTQAASAKEKLVSTSRSSPSLKITVTATSTRSVHSLSRGRETPYRNAQDVDAGGNGEIWAVIRSLQMISNEHIEILLCPKTRRPSPARILLNPEHLLLVTIRTTNPDLIEAAIFLREEAPQLGETDLDSVLRYQLRRFDIRWELLPGRSQEIKALRRWARTASG